MPANPRVAAPDELVVTPEELADALLGEEAESLAPLQVRPPRHGLAAVLIPRGLARADENPLRAALGVPAHPRLTRCLT